MPITACVIRDRFGIAYRFKRRNERFTLPIAFLVIIAFLLQLTPFCPDFTETTLALRALFQRSNETYRHDYPACLKT